MNDYNVSQELKVIYYCLIHSSIYGYPGWQVPVEFQENWKSFFSFNILRHIYLMNLGDRVHWFSERIQWLVLKSRDWNLVTAGGLLLLATEKEKNSLQIYSSMLWVW